MKIQSSIKLVSSGISQSIEKIGIYGIYKSLLRHTLVSAKTESQSAREVKERTFFFF